MYLYSSVLYGIFEVGFEDCVFGGLKREKERKREKREREKERKREDWNWKRGCD